MSANWTAAQLTALQSKRLDKKAAARPKGETANRMTANILRAINMQPGCVAYRVNNTGIWDEAKQVFRKAHTEPGLPDIFAVLRGRFAGIEVKAGRDKIRQEQLHRKFEIERAGGLYFEARSTDSFLEWFTKILIEKI